MFNSEEALKVEIPRDELKELFLNSAKEHRGKASYFEKLASKVDLTDNMAILEDEDIQLAYGSNSVTKSAENAKAGLMTQSREHSRKAREKEFIAAHLTYESYFLPASELRNWGII